MTDSSGKYSFQDLAPGSYQLTFARSAFQPLTRSFSLTAGQSGDVSVTLSLAGIVTSVDVIDVAGKATASRLEVPDRDLPVQVSSIPEALLEQQGVNDMVTALRNASGVQAQRFYGAYEYYTIRGFNQADVMLVDGMKLEGNRPNTQLNNVESVEVLKGAELNSVWRLGVGRSHQRRPQETAGNPRIRFHVPGRAVQLSSGGRRRHRAADRHQVAVPHG